MSKTRESVAIIGGGSSGMVAAWCLGKSFQTDVFDANDYWGGHADTREVGVDKIPVDAGAAFINRQYCPNLYKILDHYGISLTTFTLVSRYTNKNTGQDIVLPPAYFDDKGHPTLELKSLLSWRNIKTMIQLQIVLDLAKKLIKEKNTEITLKEFLDGIKIFGRPVLSETFKNDFFYPFIANAYFIDQEDYTLCELHENCQPEKNKLYLSASEEGVHYVVLNPKGEKVSGNIPYANLGLNAVPTDFASLCQYKDRILEYTTAQKHTVKPDPNFDIKKFSAYAALNYLAQGSNVKHYQWNEAAEGLNSYITKMREDCPNANFHTSTPIAEVEQFEVDGKPKYRLKLQGGGYYMKGAEPAVYDAVVLATNGEQAGELLKNVPSHRDLAAKLKGLKYYTTRVDIYEKAHSGRKKPKIVESRGDTHEISFWDPHPRATVPIKRKMNRRKGKPGQEDHPLDSRVYRHAFLCKEYYRASRAIERQQGRANIWVAGALAGGGDSHENAVDAGIDVARKITRRFEHRPSSRLKLFDPEKPKSARSADKAAHSKPKSAARTVI